MLCVSAEVSVLGVFVLGAAPAVIWNRCCRKISDMCALYSSRRRARVNAIALEGPAKPQEEEAQETMMFYRAPVNRRLRLRRVISRIRYVSLLTGGTGTGDRGC